jgi:hypothetical protein
MPKNIVKFLIEKYQIKQTIMTSNKYNHQEIYKAFLDKSGIIELYLHLGGSEPVNMSNGSMSAHAFWRGDNKRSLTITADKDLAFDFASNKGFNSFSMATEVTGSKEQAYLAMCQVAGVDINKFEKNQ